MTSDIPPPRNLFTSVIRKVVDSTLVPFLEYLSVKRRNPFPLLEELDRLTVLECAQYVQQNMPTALSFRTRQQLWQYALSKRSVNGIVAEFGVWNGLSINYIAKTVNQTVYGFDSFEGLQEDWRGHGLSKGAFDLDGKLPQVQPNVRLIKGWFDETLPPFLATHTEPFSFIHVDCDTYEATKVLLDLVGSRIVQGTVLVFDEYFGYRGWKLGEFKAWHDYVALENVRYDYFAFGAGPVALIVIDKGITTTTTHAVELSAH
jgi:hypothetical protein